LLCRNGKTDKGVLRQLAAQYEDVAAAGQSGCKAILPPKAVRKDELFSKSGTRVAGAPIPLSGALQNKLDLSPSPKDHIFENVNLTSSSHISNSSVSTVNIPEKVAKVDAEKGFEWEGYEKDTLPDKIHGHVLRNLRHQSKKSRCSVIR
jgi:hypothetical protein